MKFRTGLVMGIVLGFVAAVKWLARDEDPYIVGEGSRPIAPQSRTARLVNEQGRKISNRFAEVGLDAISRARANIQSRLSATDDPNDPNWN
jgi:hypothetical protein